MMEVRDNGVTIYHTFDELEAARGKKVRQRVEEDYEHGKKEIEAGHVKRFDSWREARKWLLGE